MRDFKRLGYPLLIILVSAITIRFIGLYLTGDFVDDLLKILTIASLFLFGTSLNRNKGSKAVFKKVISLICVLILMFMQLGLINIVFINEFFGAVGINSFFVNMLFIYFGYLFMD